MEVAAIGWAIGAVGWLVSPCISKLLDRALAQLQSNKKRKDRILSLATKTIPPLKLVLEAVESSERKHFFEDLVTKLRSAFYAMEDILDEIEYARRLGSGTNKSVGMSSLLDHLDANVKEIEKLIGEASGNIKMANLQKSDNLIANVTANDTKTPTTSDLRVRVTGRVKEAQEINKMLRQRSSSDSTQLSVIGIFGVPGSGKTTLAQCVFKYESDCRYFDLVIWIHVSAKFSVKTIYSEIFAQAWNQSGKNDKNHPQYDSLEILTKELKNLLKEKKILLVLDDIWFSKDQGDLELLLSPLKDGKEGSKILVTSRQDSLSCLGPDVTSVKYEIPDMDDEDFLKLFMHHALNINNVKSEHVPKFRDIGARIAEKLKKSPLLAITVGRTLFCRRKAEIRDWINVRDQNLLNDHMGALWWCYQHLREQVRRCFCYCSIFPRRYHLHRDELVKLWVAQGLVDTTNGEQDMEKVGRDYFEELVSTSFLLPRGKDKDKGEYFLIHDLLHDLAVNVAGSDFCKIEHGWTEEPSLDVRHIFIQNCTASMVTDHIVKLKKLRPLIIQNAEPGVNFDTVFKSLPMLRVFICKISSESYRPRISVPESISDLKLLRYLGVSRTSGPYDITLPSTLHKLYLLQVIDLDSVQHVHGSLHQDMINLIDLRHIICGFCFQNIGVLTSLQSMLKFVVARLKGYELHQLKHLNKLQGKMHICGLEKVQSKEEAVEAKLSDKEGLTELVLEWSLQNNSSVDLQADVLEALCPPKYLTKLTIKNYNGSRYPSWMVGAQNNTTYHLDELVLTECSQPACAPELFFIAVSSLVLEKCRWDTLPYNMGGLRSLKLVYCHTLPTNMEFLTSLKSLLIRIPTGQTLPTLPRSLDYIEITGCGWNLREDPHWEKVRHIPHIVCNAEKLIDLVTAGPDDTDSIYTTTLEGIEEDFYTARNSHVSPSQGGGRLQARTSRWFSRFKTYLR